MPESMGVVVATAYLGLVPLLLYAWQRGKPRQRYVVYWYGPEGPPQRETWHDWVDKQWAKFRGRPGVGVSVRSCQHEELAAAQAHFDAIVTPPSLPGTFLSGVTREPMPCIKVLISDGRIIRWPEPLSGCLPFFRLCHVLGRAVQDKALQLPPGTYYGWWYVAAARSQSLLHSAATGMPTAPLMCSRRVPFVTWGAVRQAAVMSAVGLKTPDASGGAPRIPRSWGAATGDYRTRESAGDRRYPETA